MRKIHKLISPSFDKRYKISSTEKKISFSFHIFKCSKSGGEKKKKKSTIISLLQNTIHNIYQIKERRKGWMFCLSKIFTTENRLTYTKKKPLQVFSSGTKIL